MASGNKPTMVHFSLIFFVMATLISVVIAIMGHNDNAELSAQNADLLKKNTDFQNLANLRGEWVQYLKSRIGEEPENVLPESDATSLAAIINARLAAAAGQVTPNTLFRGLEQLRSDLNNANQVRTSLEAEVNDLKAKMLALNTQYGDQSAAFRNNANTAEANLQASIKDKEESLSRKDTQINDLRSNLNQVQQELDQTKERYEKLVAEQQVEIKKLVAINNKIREELENVTRVSFEKPDGELRWVDYSSKLVWVNLGEVDKLPVGSTFSVYAKGHHGVGRGAEDIKGSIEITRVIGSHLAEGRILRDDPAQPMAVGDPIYTPLWTAGRSESIAVAGFIDIDDDKQSDRAMFHDLVAAYGARIDVEIDDEGNRLGDGLTAATKYLVMASIPDLTKLSGENEKKAAEKVTEELKKLRDECRLQGIRVITLSDFLSQIGYKPQRRNWRPGEESQFNLKSGSRSTGTNETLGNREAAGTVSGVYKNTKRVGPAPSASGTTSKLFGGGTGGR